MTKLLKRLWLATRRTARSYREYRYVSGALSRVGGGLRCSASASASASGTTSSPIHIFMTLFAAEPRSCRTDWLCRAADLSFSFRARNFSSVDSSIACCMPRVTAPMKSESMTMPAMRMKRM